MGQKEDPEGCDELENGRSSDPAGEQMEAPTLT
jgi:hypothetical protein